MLLNIKERELMLFNDKNILDLVTNKNVLTSFFIMLVMFSSITFPVNVPTQNLGGSNLVYCDTGDTGACSTGLQYETKMLVEANETGKYTVLDVTLSQENRYNSSDRIALDNTLIFYYAPCSDNTTKINYDRTNGFGIMQINVTQFLNDCSNNTILVMKFCPMVTNQTELENCLFPDPILARFNDVQDDHVNNTIESKTYNYNHMTIPLVDKSLCFLVALVFAFLGGAIYISGSTPFRFNMLRMRMPKTKMYRMRPKSMSFTMMSISSLGGRLASKILSKKGKDDDNKDNDKDKKDDKNNNKDNGNENGEQEGAVEYTGIFRQDSKLNRLAGIGVKGYVNFVKGARWPIKSIGKKLGKSGIIGIKNENKDMGDNEAQTASAINAQQVSKGMSGGSTYDSLNQFTDPSTRKIRGTNFGEIMSNLFLSKIMGIMISNIFRHYSLGISDGLDINRSTGMGQLLGWLSLGGQKSIDAIGKLFGKQDTYKNMKLALTNKLTNKVWKRNVLGFFKHSANILKFMSNPFSRIDNYVQSRNVKKVLKKINETLSLPKYEILEMDSKKIKELNGKINIKNIDPKTGDITIEVNGYKTKLDNADLNDIARSGQGGQILTGVIQNAKVIGGIVGTKGFWTDLETLKTNYENADQQEQISLLAQLNKMYDKYGVNSNHVSIQMLKHKFENYVNGTETFTRQEFSEIYKQSLGNISKAFVSMEMIRKIEEQQEIINLIPIDDLENHYSSTYYMEYVGKQLSSIEGNTESEIKTEKLNRINEEIIAIEELLKDAPTTELQYEKQAWKHALEYIEKELEIPRNKEFMQITKSIIDKVNNLDNKIEEYIEKSKEAYQKFMTSGKDKDNEEAMKMLRKSNDLQKEKFAWIDKKLGNLNDDYNYLKENQMKEPNTNIYNKQIAEIEMQSYLLSKAAQDLLPEQFTTDNIGYMIKNDCSSSYLKNLESRKDMLISGMNLLNNFVNYIPGEQNNSQNIGEIIDNTHWLNLTDATQMISPGINQELKEVDWYKDNVQEQSSRYNAITQDIRDVGSQLNVIEITGDKEMNSNLHNYVDTMTNYANKDFSKVLFDNDDLSKDVQNYIVDSIKAKNYESAMENLTPGSPAFNYFEGLHDAKINSIEMNEQEILDIGNQIPKQPEIEHQTWANQTYDAMNNVKDKIIEKGRDIFGPSFNVKTSPENTVYEGLFKTSSTPVILNSILRMEKSRDTINYNLTKYKSNKGSQEAYQQTKELENYILEKLGENATGKNPKQLDQNIEQALQSLEYVATQSQDKKISWARQSKKLKEIKENLEKAEEA